MKKTLLLIAILGMCLSGFSQIKISEMTHLVGVCDTCWVPIVKGSLNYKARANQISVPFSRTITINGVTYDLSTNRSWTVSVDTSDISDFSTKVRSLFNATYPLIYSNGNYHLDTASGKWRSEGYYDTKYLSSIPTLQQVTDVGNTTTKSISIGDTLLMKDHGYGSSVHGIFETYFGGLRFSAPAAYPNGGFYFNIASQSAPRSYTWPNKDGTVAMYQDIIDNLPNPVNFKKDSVFFFRLDPTQNTATNGWTKGASYSSNVTETVVSDGLQISNAATGGGSTNSVYNAGWESCINEQTTTVTYKIVTIGGTAPQCGIFLVGATNFIAKEQAAILALNTKTVYFFSTASTAVALGGLTARISVNDVIRISFRKFFDDFYITISNLTQGGPAETFVRHEAGASSATSSINNVYPGIYVNNATVVAENFVFYGNHYRPKIIVLTSSILQNQRGCPTYDSSYTGYLQKISTADVLLAGGAANALVDVQDSRKELIAIKGEYALCEFAYNNLFAFAEADNVWQPQYKTAVDSVIKWGYKPIIIKLPPSNNTVPARINAFIDSVFTNDPRVEILDLSKVAPLYDTSFANNCNTNYYLDGVHLKAIGGRILAEATAQQLDRILHKFKLEAASDIRVDSNAQRDGEVLFRDSTGLGQSTWKPYKLIGATLDRTLRTITVGSVGGSLPSIGNQGQVLQVSNGAAAWKYDTTTLVTFSAGARLPGDTAEFTDSTLYGSFYLDGNDTLIITKVRAVLNGGTSDTLGYNIWYNDTINVIGSPMFSITEPVNSTTTGNLAENDDYTGGSPPFKIPPGNWVWMKTPTVVAGRKPTYLSISIIGYKKRVN